MKFQELHIPRGRSSSRGTPDSYELSPKGAAAAMKLTPFPRNLYYAIHSKLISLSRWMI
jgi:hypothetical protein